MDGKLVYIIQAIAGVACIVSAVLFLSKPEHLAMYTLVSNLGAGMLGNLAVGPGQLTRGQHERVVQQMKVPSVPPPPPAGR